MTSLSQLKKQERADAAKFGKDYARFAARKRKAELLEELNAESEPLRFVIVNKEDLERLAR